MYPYNFNYNTYQGSIYQPARNINNNDERFAGGLIGPLLLGGVAGYALGQTNYNRPYMFYTQPYPYYYPNYYPYPYYRK